MIKLIRGDCTGVMARMPEKSVHCVVTSPPYWGLRDYGTAKWVGGDEGCDHRETDRRNNRPKGEFHGGDDTAQTHPFRDICGKCGARRIDRQLGLEPTPDAFVETMVRVFCEVRRVLRDDGTCWLNLGDSYCSNPAGNLKPRSEQGNGEGRLRLGGAKQAQTLELGKGKLNTLHVDGLKPKDLIGIPWRVAFALQADGWYLRSDIVWAKPNPMPESVRDRPTKSHEYLFLLTKRERYFFDAEAVRESAPPCKPGEFGRKNATALRVKELTGNMRPGVTWQSSGGRNLRSVWTIPTQSFKGAHFATFPQRLVEPCVKAGCPPGGMVLDPFAGAGTVGVVCDRLGRDHVGIDLNPEYVAMARRRIAAERRKCTTTTRANA